MEAIQQIPWSIVLITTAALLSGFFGLVLVLMKFPAARQLGRFLMLHVLLFAPAFYSGIYEMRWITLVLIVVQLYLYAVTFFSQKTRISFKHLIPVVVVASLYWADQSIQQGVSGLIFLFYVVSISSLLRKEGQQRGIHWFMKPGSRVIWFRNFIVLNIVGLATILLVEIPVSVLGSYIILLVLGIVYQVFKESQFLTPIPVGNKYQKSTLTPQIKSAILERIESVMVDEEFYLRDDASLSNLAKALGASTHHLSQVLNESMKISFQDLIARYRVRRACKILRDDEFGEVKIENVASMVGYNSKSAFNTAFKRRTGLTPSEYRVAKDVQTYGEEPLSDKEDTQSEERRFDLNHVFNFKIQSDMIQHFFKIFIRNVKRNSLFSFLNVFGLTIGFTCSILIYLYIQDELSYDTELPDSDRIYRIAWISDNPQTRTPHPMAQAMVSNFPEVEEAVSLSPWYGSGLSKDLIRVKNVKRNIIFEEPDFYFADSTFFEMFQVGFIEGDERALYKPWTLVITESMAKKYFGDSSAVGKELDINDMALAVSAVVKDMPRNSHFHFNAIIPYVTLKKINPNDTWMTWADFGHFNYIKLKNGVDTDELEAKIPDWALNYLDWSESGIERLRSGEMGFSLQPIDQIHLTSHLRWELENNGNILYVYILTGTLVFLLLIASINYVNLTTAKSIERAKEVGVRKTLGGEAEKISIQFYIESIVLCLVAMVISVALAALALSSFNFLSGKLFELSDLLNTSFILKALAFCIIIGLIAGIYPAMVLSSYKPTDVLKGKLSNGSKGVRLRSVLVILQFTISAILISGSLMIFKQIQYMKEKDLGFDQDALISLNVPRSIEIGGIDLDAIRTTQNQLVTVNGVQSSALVSSLPGGQFNQHGYFLRNTPDDRVDASTIMVDFGIEDILGLEVVQGRTFDRSYAKDSVVNILINETMASMLDVEDPIGVTIVQDASGMEYEHTIIGVIKDFHFQSLHQEIQPLILAVQPFGASHILVKMEGKNFTETIAQIESIYNENIESDLPFEYHFLDQQLAELYNQEMRSLSIFSFFALIALALACMGLLGMAIAILNQRIKEVGMRKILGATSTQIMGMIFGQFAKLIVVAGIIGIPISYLLLQRWIQEFSYQVSMGFMPFIWAIMILLIVAIASVFSAVMKITYSNPVDSLRYE